MWFFVALSAMLVASISASVPELINSKSSSLKASSKIGRHLLAHSRQLNDNQDIDLSFIGDYSIKFQGCHHVSQWNADVDDEDDVRVKTKRLVRFRLCPNEYCSSSQSTGCSSKYGDYVVDMNTFVEAYLDAMDEEMDNICQETASDCQELCNNDEECTQTCYESYNLANCLTDDDGNNNDELDPADYTQCTEFNDFRRRLNKDKDRRQLEDGIEYYIGPHCADQGGEIHLGLFADDTCTTFVSSGESLFYNAMGYQLPYSQYSLISQRCMSCGSADDNGDVEVKDMCQNVYAVAGKCETKMNVDYPNESACTYIEGIKIIREDGVIRTSKTRKSTSAAICIGLFLTLAVLLAAYGMYLRTKLGRAKVNLSAAAGGTLT